jgi:4-hydroxybenzoyl-CoA reductase subunit beta
MLRLPAFTFTAPESVEGVLAALAERPGRARLLAGGTDLLPNLKHGIEEADVVVSLRQVAELRAITATPDGGLALGATATLEEVSRHPIVRQRFPSLAQAAGFVAGPHHRRMGTLGGNVCLNTRCVYINQTYFWRSSLGFCLKKDGEVCHVVKGGKRCVAAASNDTAPPLMTLGARLELRSARGTRELALSDFFVKDGVNNKVLAADELLTRVLLPAPRGGQRASYVKMRPRGSIDFPRLGVAVAFRIGGAEGASALAGEAVVSEMRVVVTAMAAVPQALRDVGEIAEGKVPGDALWDEVAASAYKQCHPLTNIDGDPVYRREMVPVMVKRALRGAAG